MLRFIGFAVSIALSIALWIPIGSHAQNQTEAQDKSCTIFLVIQRAGSNADTGFRDYLEDNGFECKFIVRNIQNDQTQLPRIVEEIKEVRPDLIYTQTTSVTRGIVGRLDEEDPDSFITDIPVVFALVSDPERSNLVPARDSKDQPLYSNRNLTGARHVVSNEVRLKAMMSYLPVKKLGVIYDASSSVQRQMIDDLKGLADKFGIELVADTAVNAEGKRDPDQLLPMIQRIAAQKPDILYMPPSNFFGPNADLLTTAALDAKLPTFCGVETYLYAKCLAGLVSPFYSVGRLAGYKAEQILKGEKTPDIIPIETLSRFSFVVNMVTARALEAYPPMNILRYAHILN